MNQGAVVQPRLGSLYVVADQNMSVEMICYFVNIKMGMTCARGSLEELLETCEQDPQDDLKLVLLDFESSGIAQKSTNEIRDLVNKLGDAPIMLFNFNTDERIKKWVAAGIRGFLYDSDPLESMVTAIRVVMDGQVWIPKLAITWGLSNGEENMAVTRNTAYSLTKREKEILASVAAGNTNTEVANMFFISPHTVKVHVQNIYKKIGVPNRVKATIWAHNYLDL